MVHLHLSPYMRKLSSSCGTCIRFTADNESLELMDRDCEAVYEILGENNNKEEYVKLADIS